jgi:hypothetical protein
MLTGSAEVAGTSELVKFQVKSAICRLSWLRHLRIAQIRLASELMTLLRCGICGAQCPDIIRRDFSYALARILRSCGGNHFRSPQQAGQIPAASLATPVRLSSRLCTQVGAFSLGRAAARRRRFGCDCGDRRQQHDRGVSRAKVHARCGRGKARLYHRIEPFP